MSEQRVIQQLSDAARGVEASDTALTRQALRRAVDQARDSGAGWMEIGDVLGIARGNAYQRYRKRPA